MDERCIIIGAGHAGSQAAISLRQEGYAGEIILINDETDIPYHKPPLSKSYLKAPEGAVWFCVRNRPIATIISR